MSQERNTAIASIRYDLDLPKDISDQSEMISFQNESIRPILKFQNDLIQKQFEAYCVQRKTNLTTLDTEAISDFVHKSLTTDQLLKSFYLGLICALFKSEEFDFYLSRKREINKRIIAMLIQRIISHVQ